MNASFYNEIKEILISARNKVYQTANFAMVEAYWNIGKSIIEEQGGNEKAEYGTGLLKELSKQMTQDFGKGFTVANLKNMRQFYLTFPNGYALRSELSWTHYRLLMRVENENAREFYMQEAVKSQWSTRQLERQINSFFYERLLSSKNKEQVAAEIQTLEPAKKPEDVIRDPYVLEFLGLPPNDDFYESDFTGCMSALQANQVYFVTRLSPTDERKKTWLFTDVYHKSDECYVAKKDNENSDMFTGTLKGVKVAGQMGSIDITMTKYLYPDAEIQELDNTPNMLLAVKNGKADLACMNAVSAAMSVAANDDLVVVDKLTWEPTDEFDKGCGLCMAYGNEDFANWCNGFFSDIKAEGLWDQMQSDAAAELDAKALEDFIAQ